MVSLMQQLAARKEELDSADVSIGSLQAKLQKEEIVVLDARRAVEDLHERLEKSEAQVAELGAECSRLRDEAKEAKQSLESVLEDAELKTEDALRRANALEKELEEEKQTAKEISEGLACRLRAEEQRAEGLQMAEEAAQEELQAARSKLKVRKTELFQIQALPCKSLIFPSGKTVKTRDLKGVGKVSN